MIICARELNSWRTRHGVSSLCEFTLQPSFVYSASTPNTRPDPGEAPPPTGMDERNRFGPCDSSVRRSSDAEVHMIHSTVRDNDRSRVTDTDRRVNVPVDRDSNPDW